LSTDPDKEVLSLDLNRVRVANELPDIHHHGMDLADGLAKTAETPIQEPKHYSLSEIKRAPNIAEPDHAHNYVHLF
jgi:hypothetical protein